jgi:hypothetical protein
VDPPLGECLCVTAGDKIWTHYLKSFAGHQFYNPRVRRPTVPSSSSCRLSLPPCRPLASSSAAGAARSAAADPPNLTPSLPRAALLHRLRQRAHHHQPPSETRHHCPPLPNLASRHHAPASSPVHWISPATRGRRGPQHAATPATLHPRPPSTTRMLEPRRRPRQARPRNPNLPNPSHGRMSRGNIEEEDGERLDRRGPCERERNRHARG